MSACEGCREQRAAMSEERELIEQLARLLDSYDRSSMSIDRGLAQSLAQRRRRALERAEEYLGRSREDR